ncbi:MAG: RNA-binding protein [bacterium]|nr:RNA-binding protein [bacterium]
MAMKLYVGGLSYNIDDQKLEEIFAEQGKVLSATVIKDRETGRSKGFGFVEMENDDDGKKAIEDMNGKELDGRSVTVNEARPQEPRQNGGGGGGFRKRY